MALRPRRPVVRVVASRLREDDDVFHWKWDFVSDLPWQVLSSSRYGVQFTCDGRDGATWENLFGLLDRPFGPYTVTMDIEVVRDGSTGAEEEATYKVRYKHTGGLISTESNRVRFSESEWRTKFRTLETRERRARVPSKIETAVVNGQVYSLELIDQGP